MDPPSRTVEERLARVAAANHGVVTRGQALALGITVDELRRRVRRGALLREYRGVYRVGHRAPSVEARYLAAVRACGDGALLTGRAMAFLAGIVRGTPPPPEVIAPTERRIAGLIIHRSRSIDRRDATAWHGIPATTIARTVVELAAILDEETLARACHESGVRFRLTPRQVETVLARRPNAPGARKLRRVMHGDVRVSLSGLERSFLALLRDAGLVLPVTNRVASARRVDCRWAQLRLTVELDSYRYHASRHAWEQDRRREREAFARGDEIRRYTYDDVFASPGLMMRELRGLLPFA
jgi:hypothetical protein